jgi:uncharacterized protein YjbJ (UPF0337 family)
MEEKKDKFAGQVEESKGDLKEGLGDFRGDEQQQAEGKGDQLTGKVKQGIADAKEKVGDFLDGDDKK